MPDWLLTETVGDGSLAADHLVFRLLAALACGLGVAAIYRCSHGRDGSNSTTLMTTFVLLSVLIAMVSMTIGSSVARAFSLVGALSIVRFRTVVDDTRNTAFVIFAVIVGMACGAGLLMVPLAGMPIVGAAALGLSYWKPNGHHSSHTPVTLKVRYGLGRDPRGVLLETIQRHLGQVRLMEAATARQGAALDLTYAANILPETVLSELVSQLNQVEGVLSAEVAMHGMPSNS